MKTIINYVRNIGVVIIVLLILYLLNPFNKDYLVGYLLVGTVFIKRDFIKTNLDLDFFLLLLFSVIYASFYSFNADTSQGKQYIFIYALFPPTFYMAGKILTRNNLAPKTIFYLLFGIGSVFSISAVISVFINFQEGGFAQLERTIPMFWNGNPVSATIMGGFLTFNMCIPALVIVNRERKEMLFNISALILFFISLICVLRLGSRTQLGIFLLTTILAIFYVFPRQTLKKNITLFLILLGVIFYVSRNVSFSLDADWMTTFASRMSGGTGELASGGGRTERWTKSFEYLFSHPLGWELKEFGYSHNLWLDVLRVSGIIPFIILTIYSIRSFFQVKRTISIKKSNINLNAQILVYAIAIFLLFMVEPIFEGLFPFFIVFCLFKGMINQYYNDLQQL